MKHYGISMLGAAILTSASAEITVEPAGVQVVWQSLDKEFDGFKTYNSDAGVSLTMVAKTADSQFIGFIKDGSKVSFKDGDTDLGGKFGFFNKISKDGKAMRVEVKSEKLPAKGAESVQAKGTIDVMVASESETKTIAAREFKKDDELELNDDFKFTVKSIGKPKWGDNPLQITFEWKRKKPGKVEELKAVRFYSEDGEQIKSSDGGTSWSGFLGKYTTTKSYTLKKDAKKLKIEMDLWKGAKKVTVPIDIDLKIGGAN